MNSLLGSPPQSTSDLHDVDSSRPSTPQQRGRPSSRYPTSLGPGHVPLHRRGTSKTYECLEDLLREAGYKETRVFTPETERAEIEAEERKERELQGQNGTVKAGVGVVVGFLAGLMSRNSNLVGEAEGGESSQTKSSAQQEYSPPPSPLAQRQRLKSKLPDSSVSLHSHPISPTFMSSVESLPRSPLSSSSNLNPNYRIVSSNSNATSRTHRQALQTRPSRLRPRSSLTANQVPQPYAQTSKARAYLRHMASAPSIQPLSKPTRESLHRHASSRAAVGRGYTRRTMVLNDSDSESDRQMGRRGNGEGEEEGGADGRPPLPRTWLESVARAVLFGGAGAHIGGPPPPPTLSLPQSPKSRMEIMKMSPSSSNSALSDHTNAPRNVLLKRRAAPYLCAQVATQRTPSETRVSRTKVFCRSAPTSRSGSKVRGSGTPVNRIGRGREKNSVLGKEKAGQRKLIKGRGREKLEVPSLARTKAQNDAWTKVDGDVCTSSSEDEDEDEDEGELDLARLLVPSKRQNSIRSLRKHLHAPSQVVGSRSGTSSATGSMREQGTSRRDSWDEDEPDGDEDTGDDWRRRIWGMEGGSLRARADRGTWEEGDVEGEVFERFLGTGASSTGTGTKRRRGIPGAWAQ